MEGFFTGIKYFSSVGFYHFRDFYTRFHCIMQKTMFNNNNNIVVNIFSANHNPQGFKAQDLIIITQEEYNNFVGSFLEG